MYTKSLPILFTMLLFSVTAPLKSQRVEPIKRDNIIVIIADASALKNMDNFGKHLIDNGYSFATIDRNFGTITTDERVSEGGYKHKLHVSFRDSTINVRATCNMLMLGSSIGNYQTTWIDWQYAKSRSNIYNLHYRAFIPVITSFNKPFLFYQKP